MSFPSTKVINDWFQEAHDLAVEAGGSVYVMEKQAEREVVSSVLRWAYLNMLGELQELGYSADSRVQVHINKLLDELHNIDNVDDTKDDEFADDYNNNEDDNDKETSVEIDDNLLIEIMTALIKSKFNIK